MRYISEERVSKPMPFFRTTNITIEAIACCLPEKVVQIGNYHSTFGRSAVEKFSSMTGVKSFYRCSQNQTASDLGYVAAEKIIADKNLDRQSIGALIFVSQFPDYPRPATACVLHKRLKLSKDCLAYDINLGCSSYVYGLHTVASLMETSDVECALLIVCDTISKTLPEFDPTITMLFGDAGSATLLSKKRESLPICGMFRTIGSGYKAIIYPLEGFRNRRFSSEEFQFSDGVKRTLNQPLMNGKAVFEFTITEVPKLIKDFIERTQCDISSYDAVILHQANLLILKQLAKKLKISDQQLKISIDQFGNTSGVSLPLTLCKSFESNNGKTLKTLFSGFGIGLSLGVVDAHIKSEAILGIVHSDGFFAEGFVSKPEDLSALI